MSVDGSQALVTGAGGFIGSHLVEELVEAGANVRAFVRYTSAGGEGNLRLLPTDTRAKVEVVAGDLRDPLAVSQAMLGCDFVVHLAALIAIPYSYVHPREVIETNVLGSFNVFEAARQVGPRRVVHLSTSEVYGTALTVPIAESHPLQGQSPYSASKIGADRIAESYWRAFDVPITTVRPFNTYGPRQTARAIIPTIVAQALTADRLTIGSLGPTRDFTFVRDTARGLRLAAEAPGVDGLEINLGTGSEISIGDLAGLIQELTESALPVEVDERRLRPERSEVERLMADATLAKDRLGWEPLTSLREGLTLTIAWIKEHLDRFEPGRYQI
jgi:dTDP-glucose 4,6-dehydratase